MELWSESPARLNCDNFGLGFLGASNLFYPFNICWAVGFHSFSHYEAVSFQGYCRARENGDRTCWNPIKFTVLTDIQPYFSNKHFLDYWKPLVNFHHSEIVDNFCQCSGAFMELQIFRNFYFTNPECFFRRGNFCC